MAGKGGYNGKLSADAKLQHALECVMQAAGRVESAMRGEPGSAERAAAVQAARIPYSGRVGLQLRAADMLLAYAGVLDQLADKYGLGAMLDLPGELDELEAIPFDVYQARAGKAFDAVPGIVRAELKRRGRVDCNRVAELAGGPADLALDLAQAAYGYLRDNWESIGEWQADSIGDRVLRVTESTEVFEGLSLTSLSELSPDCSAEWRAAAIEYLAQVRAGRAGATYESVNEYRTRDRRPISSAERSQAAANARVLKAGGL